MFDMREKCGLFGVFNSENVARDIYLGLYAQQHRGQESAGIITSSGHGQYHLKKGLGLVTNVFNEENLNTLKGNFGIGHVRYSTAGGTDERDIQPLALTHRHQVVALAHNGNLVNAARLKEDLEAEGSLFTSTSDTESFLHRIMKSRAETIVEKVQEAAVGVEGAYSLLLLYGEGIAAIRDPHGFRPLFLGRKGETFYFASETCAFDILGAECVREVAPGEILHVTRHGIERYLLPLPVDERMCSFEPIYFSRPDGLFKGRSIHSYRLEMGAALAAEHPIAADLVSTVPDSSNSAAIGYARASGIPLDLGLIRSHYTGRTFIAPYQSLRDFKVRKKFNVIADVVRDKRVIVVDDSIVRGTTSRKIVQMFRERGAKEVHFRISSPAVRFPCFFGIDMPDRDEFLANRAAPEKLAEYLGADTIGYLSAASLTRIVGAKTCQACFTGEYPVDVKKHCHLIGKNESREEEDHVHL